MTNMLDHVTCSRDQTGYKYPALCHKFQLLAPAHLPNYSRLNSFTLNFELLFNSLFQLPILFFLWSERKYSTTFSNHVCAKLRLHLIEVILRHFSNCVVAKIRIYLPTQSILLLLESKQCPLTLVAVLACADSVDELRF